MMFDSQRTPKHDNIFAETCDVLEEWIWEILPVHLLLVAQNGHSVLLLAQKLDP
jgi:hypothetical protein